MICWLIAEELSLDREDHDGLVGSNCLSFRKPCFEGKMEFHVRDAVNYEYQRGADLDYVHGNLN